MLFFGFRKLYTRLGGPHVLTFYQDIPKSQFHFCYINNNKNYLINCIEELFSHKRATMFANNETFIIHSKNQSCDQPSTTEPDNIPIKQQLNDFIQMNYPKQKFLNIVGNILTKHELINDELCFVDLNTVHIADFFSFINNRFSKGQIEPRITKLCKLLQNKLVKFPNICIKNPLAKKYFC